MPPTTSKHQGHTHQTLDSILSNSPHDFLQPSTSLHRVSLAQAKQLIDPLAIATCDDQRQRQQAARRKRKRGKSHNVDDKKPLAMKQVYLEGFNTDQVWEQARRILDASREEVKRSLSIILSGSNSNTKDEISCRGHRHEERAVRFQDGEGDGLDLVDSERAASEDGRRSSVVNGAIRDLEGTEIASLEGSGLAEDTDGVEDEEPEDAVEGDEEMGSPVEEQESAEVFVPDKLGLNDGFFSIDDFNRQSEFLEQQDFRGENDGAASDEEDVDWGADPLAAGTYTALGNEALQEEDAGDSPDDGHGPTFGNADLNVPDLSDVDDASDHGVQMEDLGAIDNTNDIKYADFFAPPPSKLTKSGRDRALPKTQPPLPSQGKARPSEEDLQRTISAVRRDIFEDDLTPDEDGDSGREDPEDGRSSHQKRQAKLTEEIRRLEAAAIAKRDWTLSGEARAADRPINSLLEEDLEFERAGKPIPVITQEVSEDIEALIKRRILAKEFDEVIRRRPDHLATGNGKEVRRGRFELEDGKPQQSLAEIYEAEHLKTIDPGGYVDKRDEKLKKEHAKIEAIWKDVSGKLDALSSLHFRPKPPQANITVVADVATITMEDARPAAGGDVGGGSMLAPQELYKPGEGRDKKVEVGTRSGLPVAREEMTREEKVRRRRREKERIRKAGGLGAKNRAPGNAVSKKVEEKKGIIKDLKKGGVRIIGRKGEIRDVEGKAVRGAGTLGRGAGAYKL
ncbi:MAG: hypothetical protein Q9163_002505 [Psora crenata]